MQEAHRCPRCHSRHYTDCYDPKEPLPQGGSGFVNGRLLALSILLSWVAVCAIVLGLKACFVP